MGKFKTYKKKGLILIIIGLGIIWGIALKNYKDALDFREIRKQYNEKQENCVVVGNTLNYVYLSDYSEDTKGAIWELTNLETKKTYQFEINKEGVGGLVGLKNGAYTLKEIQAPKGGTLNNQEYYVNFSEYNHSYEINLNETNGAFVLMLENKNGEPVSGVKFNFYSSEGVLLHELETDNDGFIGLVNLIKDNDSIFYVEQSGVATPRRFYMRIGKDDIYRIDLVINNEGVIE